MKKVLIVAALLFLAGCGANQPLIQDERINLTTKIGFSTTQLVTIGILAAVIYLVYDPLAPNWEIKEQKLAEDTFSLNLKMKRYHTGGQGEAMQVLRRRAAKLQAEGGFVDFQVLEYTEGIESQTMGANRYAEAKLKLLRKELPRG